MTEPIDVRAGVGQVHLEVARLDRAPAFWHEALGPDLRGDEAAPRAGRQG